MTIKLIALDLDGTTLDKSSRLSDGNRQALEEAIRRGVHVVIATGRAFSVVPPEVLQIDGMEYIITSNGAEMRNLVSDRLIYSNYIAPGVIEKLYGFLKDHPFMTEVFTGGKAYIDTYYYNTAKEVGLSYRHTQYVLDTRKPVDNVLQFMLDHKDSIENINLNFGRPEDKEKMRRLLVEFPDITLTSSFDHNLEIGGATTSKAGALKDLCARLGLEHHEIMACGDSPNDIAMLELAGCPVAVGNAKDAVKEKACFISADNDMDGVAVAVKKFVLDVSE